MNENINQVRSGILSVILPLLRNIKQDMKDLRQESSSWRIQAQSLPLSPESPSKNVTVEEEANEGIGENQMAEWEQVIDEEEKNDAVEEDIVEEKGDDSMKGDVSVFGFNATESEEKSLNKEDNEVNDSGVGSKSDLLNNNTITSGDMEEKPAGVYATM